MVWVLWYGCFFGLLIACLIEELTKLSQSFGHCRYRRMPICRAFGYKPVYYFVFVNRKINPPFFPTAYGFDSRP